MHHHRGASGSAPPPPMISSRSTRGPPPGSSRGRSRSRSRSPRGGSSRYRSERDSRDARERSDRERDRDRDRERRRSRSASPYRSSSRNDRDRDRDRKSSNSASKPSSSAPDSILPSISLVQPDPPAPSIIRRILNPEDVKIPRRVNEGAKPVFDREELREAMIRRMRANDNEENPPQANTYIQDGSAPQQRVEAIIREPVGADLYLASSVSKDPAYHHAVATSKISQRVSPGPPSRSSYHRRSRSLSPRPSSRDREVRPATNRHPSPTRMPSLPRGRSPERDRVNLDRERERDREQLQRAMERDRELTLRAGGRERLPPPERERERDLRDIRAERERELHPRDGRGDRDHRDPPHPREIRPLPGGDRERVGERDRPTRFSGPSHHPPHGLPEPGPRGRTRSPISRVPREDLRPRRRSRSHSHDDRLKRPGLPNRGGFSGRGRGGFPGRPGRGREDERRVWVHDMYDGDEEPKKGD